MFAAQIHSKLTRSEEDMEDLLTSNVFGVWRYLPIDIVQNGLLQFLGTACRLDEANFIGPAKINSISMKFWPWIQEGDAKGAEPDVVIEIVSPDERKWLLLIEAKYLSPKSSFADPSQQYPTDQLAREMHNLRTIAKNGHFDEYALLYVTAHTMMPRDDITDAISELAMKTGDGASDRFYWTTWRKLPTILDEAVRSCQGSYATLLADLQEIVLRMGFVFFRGIESNGWTLGRPVWYFKLPEKIVSFEWNPTRMTTYCFETAPIRFSWTPVGWASNQWGLK